MPKQKRLGKQVYLSYEVIKILDTLPFSNYTSKVSYVIGKSNIRLSLVKQTKKASQQLESEREKILEKS